MGFGNPTLDYFGVSESSRVRRIEKTLSFFKNFPRVIIIETSRMANPYYVIEYLANNTTLDHRKRHRRKRFIIGFLFWTGVRVNELLRTRKENIDLITRTYNVPTLKQHKRVYRPIPLNHVPAIELKLWYQYLSSINDDYIVKLSDRQIERIVKSELGVNPHALRHALGLWLYEYTKDIRVVSQILRHTNIANTLIYTRLSLDQIREKIRI